jgi:diketogulonate reductase-like aldo/keto reductase
MSDDGTTIRQPRLPLFLYGTAWKEERTEELLRLALEAGFRGIDTANQRKHYVEEAIGAAIVKSGIPRGELFLQTKFTFARGQDQRLPYDPAAPIAEQVRQSFDASLQHLAVDNVDSLLLHGPWSGDGWGDHDREAWGAMEEICLAGKVRLLGVSNVSHEQVAALCKEASVPPAFVQNACYARTGWDQQVRDLCRNHGVLYQAFALLTGNRPALGSAAMTKMAARTGATVNQLVFRFAIEAGMLPLTGTSSRAHMDEDLACTGISLSADDIAVIARIGQTR